MSTGARAYACIQPFGGIVLQLSQLLYNTFFVLKNTFLQRMVHLRYQRDLKHEGRCYLRGSGLDNLFSLLG